LILCSLRSTPFRSLPIQTEKGIDPMRYDPRQVSTSHKMFIKAILIKSLVIDIMILILTTCFL